MFTQLRLLLGEILMSWILSILPEPNKSSYARALKVYLISSLGDYE